MTAGDTGREKAVIRRFVSDIDSYVAQLCLEIHSAEIIPPLIVIKSSTDNDEEWRGQ